MNPMKALNKSPQRRGTRIGMGGKGLVQRFLWVKMALDG